jgi:hypothetical protein
MTVYCPVLDPSTLIKSGGVKLDLLSMLNQHFSKHYSEVICGSILMKLISLN